MKTVLSFAFCLLLSSLAFAQKTPVLFQKVRVFDGTRVIPETDVLIEGGKIREIGDNLAVGNSRVVDGAGKTLLPGLIDGHVHVHGADTLEQALIFGVTTELDMMMQPRMEAQLKATASDDRASFFRRAFQQPLPAGTAPSTDSTFQPW